MSATDTTSEEMFESLTGYDEIAIAKSFDAEIGSLASKKPTMFLRALVFVDLRRQGISDADAKVAVLDYTLKTCKDYFAENREVDDNEPVTDSGKDDSPLA